MESLKILPGGFSSVTYCADFLRKKPKSPNKKMHGLSAEGNKVIAELKDLFLETLELLVEKEKRAFKIRQDYEAKYKEIYDQRYNLLKKFRTNFPSERKNPKESKIYYFWMNAWKNSALGLTKKDQQMLEYLVDMRSYFSCEPQLRFTLELHFEANPFFENAVLTKTFFIDTQPRTTNPFAYDGSAIVKCQGCEIKWKHDPEEGSCYDFTNMFRPHVLCEEYGIKQYLATIAALENDFQVGLYIKQYVVPKAILLYLGETEHMPRIFDDQIMTFLQNAVTAGEDDFSEC